MKIKNIIFSHDFTQYSLKIIVWKLFNQNSITRPGKVREKLRINWPIYTMGCYSSKKRLFLVVYHMAGQDCLILKLWTIATPNSIMCQKDHGPCLVIFFLNLWFCHRIWKRTILFRLNLKKIQTYKAKWSWDRITLSHAPSFLEITLKDWY